MSCSVARTIAKILELADINFGNKLEIDGNGIVGIQKKVPMLKMTQDASLSASRARP